MIFSKRGILFAGLLLGSFLPAFAQREMVTMGGPPKKGGFEGHLILGINGSQVDGDQMSGYHQVGVYVGGGARLRTSSEWAFGPEFLFSMKGSRTTLDQEAQGYRLHINLQYAEIPLQAYWSPTSAKGFTFSAGPGLGILLRARETYGNLEDVDVRSRWTRYDISAIAGVDYRLTDFLSAFARFTYSIVPNNSNYIRSTPYYDQGGVKNNMITVALRLNLSEL